MRSFPMASVENLTVLTAQMGDEFERARASEGGCESIHPLMPSLTLDLACTVPFHEIQKLEHQFRGQISARNQLSFTLF